MCHVIVSSASLQEGEAGLVHHPDFLRQGNLFVQDNTKKGEPIHHYTSLIGPSSLYSYNRDPMAQILLSVQEERHWWQEDPSNPVHTHWSPRKRKLTCSSSVGSDGVPRDGSLMSQAMTSTH